MDENNFYSSEQSFQNNEPQYNYQPPQKPQKPKKQKARFSLLTVVVAAVVAGAVGVMSATVTTAYFWGKDQNSVTDHLNLEKNNVNITILHY